MERNGAGIDSRQRRASLPLGADREEVRTVSVDTVVEAAARRDRRTVVVALAFLIALSWAYLLAGAGTGMSPLEMTQMGGLETETPEGLAGMSMTTPASWTVGYAALMLLMWCIMMLAMMLPSAAPAILLFAAVNRQQGNAGRPYVATSVFVSGYLAAWGAFSLLAVTLQWGFERTGLLSSALAGTNMMFGGTLLLAAGAYQLTPLKRACLSHCRSPHGFLGAHWRPGIGGAVRMGVEHGTFCVGCCWLLMGLLFFGGVMNLYWIIGLALLVLFEKTVPLGHWLSYASGIGLSVWGGSMLIRAL